MTKEMQNSMAGMPETGLERRERNSQGYNTGASNVTAKTENSSQENGRLMVAVVEKENMRIAYERVKSNRGVPGIDSMTIEEMGKYLKENWERIKQELMKDSYNPQPVRRVEIPKPGGKGKRNLGIPNVVDRLIQQALLQILNPIFDSGFSEHSYGFREGRSAHDAVLKAKEYANAGNTWVVDIDLEKFFDRVNHDILMARIARKVKDKRVLKLIRKFLQAGVMENGLVSATREGTPQGGPLSPLLSNIILDDLDKELEKRGHCFCRYADDCNIYLRSQKAGERVKGTITEYLVKKLKLKVNEEKSAVGHPWQRKFLGFTMT